MNQSRTSKPCRLGNRGVARHYTPPARGFRVPWSRSPTDTARLRAAASLRVPKGCREVTGMAIRFVLLVNKAGQTRLAQYYEHLTLDERRALEGEIVRKCLARAENQCSFVEHRNYKVIYRRYASLFFLVGVDSDENELAILEFIHCVVETMDRYFGNVCELDIMYHLEKAHFMLDEMVMNGCIVETNKINILTPIQLMDKTT